MALKQYKVLIKGKFLPPELIENIENAFTAFRLWEAEDEAAFLTEQGADIDILVTSGNAVMGAPAALIAALPNLKAICSNGVGYDSIDTEAARSRGIVVTNTPEVLNDCVADLGMALLLDVARRISEADRFTRAGYWSQGRFPLSSKIGGKVCGIVGLGNIGQAVARRAQAFDMQIHYYNPRSRPDVPFTRHESLVALAQQADFLVLTLPGGAATRHIINADVLQALGPQGYLINIARGSVVDQQALVASLETGQIAGAGLDVFEQEPQVPDALRQRDNVVITPHIASSTRETMAAMADLVFENMLAIARGEPALTRVV
ncbi:2-hydroxyacid dehydrogenase [Pantoea sp. Bo_2]|uniref:2-hydroxyacid dehydrogenase n=1 Tax=Candidatus Pantoea gossypiicola TaxID=2608008 RepID=A0AB34CIE0_9GAMM|nr:MULTISPECIES: 2-hydroxyacid dehydrogenase [Pantoea]KAA5931023.1 2-hydroxyacid dehydrogenase [Pantoea sp. VH_8]KAA5935690.1 2-hydroxyacid dehydrogenase [Pantoea sp. VH_4]KAA5948808.1 2-hydroxyacid dehydrogenase [Pantoea sp. VH_3]KAA5955191.1 2-hydroxyacid dehydrogenase [Pantoea sp. VH_25]KAA5957657.1 2-hydroxyacid dehydrogenase [Pantoea sp. VH_24]